MCLYILFIKKGKSYVDKGKYVVRSWLICESQKQLLPFLDEFFNGENGKPVIYPMDMLYFIGHRVKLPI